jgi:class 3 adenylate cyclase/predicted ATPase
MMCATPIVGAVMDIVVWLRSLGLGKYEAAFRENEIDETVLPGLTHETLKELGVTAVGHRLKLLDAIAALREDASGKAPSVDPTTTPSAPSARPEDRAERRQVTVMFSDLVGSTALSARMDPEDLREVISAYQKCVADTVQRFGGFVAKYMGDGVLVYFGYPQAHEDDAERAVRAGLELIAAVTSLKAPVSLQTRVGIATGLVVVGDLIGSGEAQERGIVGETPNLAARLQGIAEPNSVVFAEATRKLLGNLFELQDLGGQELKGIAHPVRAWTALRPSLAEGRFEALHTSGLLPLVGREEELELLLRRWSRAKNGEGQVVLVSGEAGIGKSRLTAELLNHLASEPHTRIRNFCSPQNTVSALYPIISQLERAAGFVHDDNPHTKLNKLDTLLKRSATSAPDAALIAAMLSLPNDGRYPSLELEPPERRQRTLFALVSQVVAISRQNLVLMIFEDAHWADPTSLELLDHIVNTIPSLSALLIVTFRPEFEPRWIGRPHVAALTLNRLAEREVGAMIDGVIGNKPLPANIRQDIIERTDGIPLFVEEMTKAVLEAEGEGAAMQMAAAVPSPAAAVPASLHASLMARLDRLGPAKDVAQIGAAIGREFSHALLAAVVRKPDVELKSALDRVIAAGLLFRQGTPPHATYLFKHALVQDAAYGTLLREPRRALHARIAETLENQFVEIAESRPEIVARHCTEAGLIEKAAALWGKAGLRSLERSALAEASEQLARAISQIETLPSTPARRQVQMKLQTTLIWPLLHLKGFASPETKAAVDRANLLIEQAEAIGEPPEDPLLLYSVLAGYAFVTGVAGNFTALRDVADRTFALAEKQQGSAPFVFGHNQMGASLMVTGEIAAGKAHFDQSIALYDPDEHRLLGMRFGSDGRVLALVYRSIGLWMLGHPEAAVVDADCAIKNARAIGHATSLMMALSLPELTYRLCGNYAAGIECVRELAKLADEKGSLFWKTVALLNEARHLALTGEPAKALPMATSARNAFEATGAKFLAPLDLSVIASIYAALGKFDDARRCIAEAMNAVETNKERWFEADVVRTAGEVELESPEPDTTKAERYFERALAVARQQHAKSWELRAAMSLARLWRSQGKPQQARELLAPVYGWFTEGFDTRDLMEAKALLEELAA